MKRRWNFIPLSLILITGTGFTLWKYVTPYNNLRDLRGEFDAAESQMRISFQYLNSAVSLVDYRWNKKASPTSNGTRYYVSLISQYTSARSQQFNPHIHPAQEGSRTEVTIPLERFDSARDELFYRDKKEIYRVPVTMRGK